MLGQVPPCFRGIPTDPGADVPAGRDRLGQVCFERQAFAAQSQARPGGSEDDSKLWKAGLLGSAGRFALRISPRCRPPRGVGNPPE
jgi:hypothetical protein